MEINHAVGKIPMAVKQKKLSPLSALIEIKHCLIGHMVLILDGDNI